MYKKDENFIAFMKEIDTSTAMGRTMMDIVLIFEQLAREQIDAQIVDSRI